MIPNRVKSVLNEYKGTIVFITLMVVFKSSFADLNRVPTGSMKPTILEGDRIFINKLAYDIHLPFSAFSLAKLAEPERGDIIVFNSKVAQQRLVKRVIGIPGDTIAMRNNVLTINGKKLDYSLLSDTFSGQNFSENLLGLSHLIRVRQQGSRASNFNQLTVPTDSYLALGDNRDNSVDSRFIGFVPRAEIIGKSTGVAFSLNYDNAYLPRAQRFFMAF